MLGYSNRGRFLSLLPSSQNDVRHVITRSPGKANFETRREARHEDKLRAAYLRAYTNQPCLVGASQEVSELAGRIDANQGQKIKCPTFASARWMRHHRWIFCGVVLQALKRWPRSKIALFTIIPRRGWLIRQGDLAKVNPKNLLARFRQQLIRTNIICEDGWIIAYIHGDYTIDSNAYQLHIHLLAVGDAIPIVNSLRRLPMYKAAKGRSGNVKRPIVQRRLADPIRQIPYYLAQGFWPLKPTYMRDGTVYRARRRRRLPPACLVEFLMWFDKQKFADLVLLYGCKMCDGRIRPSDRLT